MTMENEKLKKQMNAIPVPEPDVAAREKALKAAVAEFDRQKEAEERKVKGFSRLRRLTDKTLRGGPVMRKHLAIAVGTAFGIFMMVSIMLPNFISYRKGSTIRIRIGFFHIE